MSKNVVTIRTYPAGAAAPNLPYEVRRDIAGEALLQSGITDAQGQFVYQPNLAPGPFYWRVVDPTPEPDAVRKGSSRSAGSGGSYSLAEMPIAMQILGAGVVRGYANECAPSYVSDLQYNLAAGAVVALGIPGVIYVPLTMALVNARDAAQPRQCYVVMQFLGAGDPNEGEITVLDVCGTAAASPTLPILTQTQAKWQEPLASFRLPTTASVTLTQFTDLRRFPGGNPQAVSVVRRLSLTAQTITSTTGIEPTWDSGAAAVTLLPGVTYDLSTEVTLLVKAPAGQTISLQPYLNGTGNIAAAVSSNISADHVAVTNSHVLLGVVGTGAAVACGSLVKVPSGSGSVLTGVQTVTATPR